MDEFNKQIQEAEIQVDKLSGILINLKTLLKDANEESKSATNTLEINAIKKRMEKYIDDVVKNVSNVREKLQVITIDVMPDLLHDFPNLLFLLFSFWSSHSDLKSSCILMNFSSLQNILHRQMPGCQKGTACDRERINMTNVLTKKLKELLMEFEALRQTIQDEYCEVVERQVNTVTGPRPDELITDHVIEIGSSKGDEQIFPTTFEQWGRGKVISSMEEEIQDRLDAIKEFEKRFLELYQVASKSGVLSLCKILSGSTIGV